MTGVIEMDLHSMEQDFRFTNLTCEQIGQKYGTHRKKIEKIAKESGWIRAYNDQQWLRSQYESGKDVVDISNLIGVNRNTLYVKFREMGINLDLDRHHKRKYSYNTKAFEMIDSEEKAYWLGFIMADGCITLNNCRSYRLDIGLAIQDESHLRKFMTFISDDELNIMHAHATSYIKGRAINSQMSSRIRISSNKICNDLIKLGVVSNKTGHESYPNIPSHLNKHFIRGFVDGDGSIGLYDNSRCNGQFQFFSLSSSYPIINVISNTIHDELGIKVSVKKQNRQDHLHRIQASSISAEQIINWLYDEATVYLDRKYEKYIECKHYQSLQKI